MKKLLMVVLGILVFAGVLVAALTFIAPTKFGVEREIVIERSQKDVFDYVKMIKNQKEWGPWLKKDPDTKLEYQGEDGTVGFVTKWESTHEEVGVGEQTITKIAENERVDVELKFKKPWESTSNGFTILESAGEGKTKVKWGFEGEMPRPMNIMFLFMDFDDVAGAEFEEGLKTLKVILEKSSAE